MGEIAASYPLQSAVERVTIRAVTRFHRLAFVVGAAAACTLAGAGAAFAQGGSASDGSVSPSFTGGCTAQGTIEGYGTVDPASSGGVYTVPKSGSASYTGSVPVEGDDRPTSGKVEVALPLGLPPINIKSWSNEESDETSDSGSVSWDIPDIVPGNVEMEVSGYHQDVGVRCEGRVVVKLDGGGIGSPLGIASVLGTLASLAGLVWAAVPKRGGS